MPQSASWPWSRKSVICKPVALAEPPTDKEVADLVARIARRIETALVKSGHGELDEMSDYDVLADDEPLLAR